MKINTAVNILLLKKNMWTQVCPHPRKLEKRERWEETYKEGIKTKTKIHWGEMLKFI